MNYDATTDARCSPAGGQLGPVSCGLRSGIADVPFGQRVIRGEHRRHARIHQLRIFSDHCVEARNDALAVFWVGHEFQCSAQHGQLLPKVTDLSSGIVHQLPRTA